MRTYQKVYSGKGDEEIELTDNQKLFVRDAERQGFEVDYTYSGRGMYGRECPAVCFGRDERHMHLNTRAKVQEDGLGMGYVAYAQY